MTSLYGAPLGALPVAGWILAAATAVVLALRAVRVELRAGGTPARGPALVDRLLDGAVVAVVVALVAVLARIVATGLG